MKVALVHDWFTSIGGGEKVAREIIGLYKNIDVFCLVDNMEGADREFILRGKKPLTSTIQRMPFGKTKYRNYLAIFPYAIEQFDVGKYDLVISSSSAVAKGVITNHNQMHVCYCHSPMRYGWDLYHQYLREVKLTHGLFAKFFKMVLHFIRVWDFFSAQRVDYFVANSENVAKRIKKIYNRESKVIYPPVDIDMLGIRESKENFYVTVSRIVPYKRTDLLVDAFAQMPDKKLVIIGYGPYYKKIKRKIKKLRLRNIEMTGYIPTDEMRNYLQRAKAFVFAAEEDFGITPVEAQACGTPVIAFGKGGILETVVDGKTGLFFKEQTADSLVDCVERFERNGVDYSPYQIREHTIQFRSQRFRKEFMSFIDEVMSKEHEPVKELLS